MPSSNGVDALFSDRTLVHPDNALLGLGKREEKVITRKVYFFFAGCFFSSFLGLLSFAIHITSQFRYAVYWYLS